MDTHKFFVEKLRFHLNEPDMLVLVGWFYDGKAAGSRTYLPTKPKARTGCLAGRLR